jgi:hypothetical protein
MAPPGQQEGGGSVGNSGSALGRLFAAGSAENRARLAEDGRASGLDAPQQLAHAQVRRRSLPGNPLLLNAPLLMPGLSTL